VISRGNAAKIVGQYFFQFHSVEHREDALQQRLGHLKPDEIVVLLRGVTVLHDLTFNILQKSMWTKNL
jgi:hypothetical protein